METKRKFVSVNGDFFIESDGEIKSGDWFKSKFRTENKFFHFVHVGHVLSDGYVCYDSGVTYPKSDVICKVEIDFKSWYENRLNKIKDKPCNKT